MVLCACMSYNTYTYIHSYILDPTTWNNTTHYVYTYAHST